MINGSTGRQEAFGTPIRLDHEPDDHTHARWRSGCALQWRTDGEAMTEMRTMHQAGQTFQRSFNCSEARYSGIGILFLSTRYPPAEVRERALSRSRADVLSAPAFVLAVGLAAGTPCNSSSRHRSCRPKTRLRL